MTKCKCTGKFLSKKEILKIETMDAIRMQSVLVAGLLAIVATAISVYI